MDQSNEVNSAQPITVVLVSCVSKKSATAAKAKDLYISDWFLKARCYAEREFWANRVVSSLNSKIPPRSRIVILAGDIYREFLVPTLEDKFTLEIPLRGLGIGEQLSYLKKVNQQ